MPIAVPASAVPTPSRPPPPLAAATAMRRTRSSRIGGTGIVGMAP